MAARNYPPAHARFSARCSEKDPKTGCVNWIGYKTGYGYGRLKMDGAYTYAHRAAWLLSRGPIGTGLFVCHHCDNPACVNIEHLYLGTAADNSKDQMTRGRNAAARYPERWRQHMSDMLKTALTHPNCAYRRGNNPVAKLKVDQVLEIKASGEKASVLAQRFGVTSRTIYGIRSKRLWSWLSIPEGAPQ